MIISFAALLSTLILSSGIVLFLVLLLKKMQINQLLSATLLMIVSVVFILRLFFPVEYFFTVTIPSDRLLPKIDSLLNKELLLAGSTSFSVENLLIIIWLIGSLFCLIRFFLSLQKVYLLKRILSKKPSFYYKNKKVVTVDQAIPPFVIGLIRPIIVLPELTISEKQKKYILDHELFHISSYDIWIKYLYEILSIIYWWNPVIYIFKDSFNQIIELKADEFVVSQLDQTEKIDYVETLLHVGKHIDRRCSDKNISYFPSFASSKQYQLIDRANSIFSERRNKPHKLIILLSSICCFYLSSCIVFESYIIDPEVESSTIELTKKDSFLVKVSEDNYKVYNNERYLFEVSEEDRKIQFPNLKIYNSVEEGKDWFKENN